MTRIAFCGLGRMGEPMAERLVEAGHDVKVWNRTPERADPVVERGAAQAATPAEAATGAELTVTMLADPPALRDVVFGRDGVAHGLEPGATLVDMSTVGPDTARDVAAHLPGGAGMLDAPVLGSVPQATDGSLKLFVGGDTDLFDRWRAVLELFGRPTYLGPLGSGAAMKLVANSTLGALMCGVAEALALADRLGLDEQTVLDVLAESPIGATVKSKRSRVESGEYVPNFGLSLAAKDLRLVTHAADEAGLDLRLGPAARSWFEDAEAGGLGDLDYSAVIAWARGRPASAGPADR
jgi:3-hydroxyisobutyrate dehydrogenase-like beta-hydroxyacid dehydrogenase